MTDLGIRRLDDAEMTVDGADAPLSDRSIECWARVLLDLADKEPKSAPAASAASGGGPFPIRPRTRADDR